MNKPLHGIGAKRYLVWSKNHAPLELTYRPATWEDIWGWYDALGGLYALQEDAASTDPITRCGVGILSLPADHPLTPACASHDYAYNTPTYQVFHTRAAADEMLKKNIEIIGNGKWYGLLATPFWALARLFGGRFWEDGSTR